MPQFEEQDVRAVITLSEEACKTSKEAADLANKALTAATGQAEKLASFEKAQAELMTQLKASERRITYPEFDPLRLKFDSSQRSFERLLRSKPPADSKITPIITELQRANTAAALCRMFAEGHAKKALSWDELESLEVGQENKPFSHFREMVGHLKRALDTSTSGEGSDWIPALMGTQIMDVMTTELRAAALIQTIAMPSNPWYWPYKTAIPTAYRITESTALSANPWATSGLTEAYAANKPTAKTTFSAKKIRIGEFYSQEFTVDSVMATLDELIRDFGLGLATAREAGLFNGDTTSTHLDNDTTGQGSSGVAAETVIDGLRNFYLAQTPVPKVDVSATPTTEDYLNAASKLTKAYMADIANQYFFCSPLGSIHMYANKDVRKLSDLGPGAVIVAGQIGEILGRRIVISGQMKDNLSGDGYNASGGSNDQTAILLAHLGRWKWGTRPASPMDVERLPLTDQTLLVVHDRFDLQFVGASTDNVVVGIHGVPATVS